ECGGGNRERKRVRSVTERLVIDDFFAGVAPVAIFVQIEPGIEVAAHAAGNGGGHGNLVGQPHGDSIGELHAVVAAGGVGVLVAIGQGGLEAVGLFGDGRAEMEAVDDDVAGAVVGQQGGIGRVGRVAEIEED